MITLKVLNKKRNIKVKIYRNETVGSLKEKLKNKTKFWCIPKIRIDPRDLILKFNKVTLNDDKKLIEYKIQDGSEILPYLNVNLIVNTKPNSTYEKRELEYDARMADIIKCNENITLKNGKKYSKKKYVRHYLRKGHDGFFLQIQKGRISSNVDRPHSNSSKPVLENVLKHISNDENGFKDENNRKEEAGCKSLYENQSHDLKNKRSCTPIIKTTKHASLTAVENSYESDTKTTTINNQQNKEEKKISLNITNKVEINKTTNSFNIMVLPNCSIDDLYSAISKKVRMSLCSVDIYYLGKVLVRGSIDKHNISNNDNLVLMRRITDNEPYVINVQHIASASEEGKLQQFLVHDMQTVKGLKVILREQYNVNINCIKLLFQGEELEDESIIRESLSTLELQIDTVHEESAREISIKVRNGLNNESKDLTININTTVNILRKIIESEFTNLSEDYVICCSGEIMKKNNIVSTYDVESGTEVLISHSLLIRFYIGTDNNSAKVLRYAFLPKDTVSELKLKITKRLNYAARDIHLTFDSNTLEDEMILEDAGIEDGSYIMMVSSLAGGGKRFYNSY